MQILINIPFKTYLQLADKVFDVPVIGDAILNGVRIPLDQYAKTDYNTCECPNCKKTTPIRGFRCMWCGELLCNEGEQE